MRSSWQILDEVRREYWQSLSAAEKQQRRFPGIAISLGPYSAVLKGVHEYSGLYGNVSEDEIYKFHLERTLVMADCIKNNRSRMCDLLCFETIGNATEAMAIGAVMNDERLRTIPFWVSFLCQGRQRIACGDHLSTAVRSTLERCKHKNLVAIGINCVDVYHSGGLVSVVKDTVAGYMGQLDERAWHVAVVAYPNSGEIWSKTGWYWQGGNVISPREWASLVCASGADIVGGCCRIGSSGIHALREESIRIINCERKKGKRTGGLEHTVAISEEEERAEHGRDPVDLIPTPSGR